MSDPSTGKRHISASRPSLRDSSRKQKLSRRDADDPLEMKGKLALVRETDAERDLHYAEFVVCTQEVLRSFNATSNDILVWRQPGGRLELPREVIGAEMGDGSHLLQRQVAFEIFHDVLDDRASERPKCWQVTRPSAARRSRRRPSILHTQ
jgi:hypothetical protein